MAYIDNFSIVFFSAFNKAIETVEQWSLNLTGQIQQNNFLAHYLLVPSKCRTETFQLRCWWNVKSKVWENFDKCHIFNAVIHVSILETKSRDVVNSMNEDEDPLLDAYYMYRIVKYCKNNPEDCSEMRLARIFSKIERKISSTDQQSGKNRQKRSERRRRRKRSLLFMIFSKVQQPNRPTVENRARAGNLGPQTKDY